MTLNESLIRAEDLVVQINELLHEQSLPSTLRVRAGVACLGVALDHHNAICALIRRTPPIYSSAFALVRPIFEAYTRGMWILFSATDVQIKSFAEGGKPPDAASIINAVERTLASPEKHLYDMYRAHWGSMSSFTHTGGLQVQRWNTTDSIEPSFKEAEVIVALNLASALALLAAAGIASQSGSHELSEAILALAKEA
jgi:hypothetical protein